MLLLQSSGLSSPRKFIKCILAEAMFLSLCWFVQLPNYNFFGRSRHWNKKRWVTFWSDLDPGINLTLMNVAEYQYYSQCLLISRVNTRCRHLPILAWCRLLTCGCIVCTALAEVRFAPVGYSLDSSYVLYTCLYTIIIITRSIICFTFTMNVACCAACVLVCDVTVNRVWSFTTMFPR